MLAILPKKSIIYKTVNFWVKLFKFEFMIKTDEKKVKTNIFLMPVFVKINFFYYPIVEMTLYLKILYLIKNFILI